MSPKLLVKSLLYSVFFTDHFFFTDHLYFQNAFSKCSPTVSTLVGELYNCHDHFWRLPGFPDLLTKYFSSILNSPNFNFLYRDFYESKAI